MTTKLEGKLTRELLIGEAPYTLTLDPSGFRLVPKGKRKGFELECQSFVSGEAALATALNASLAQAPNLDAAQDSNASARDGAKGAVQRSLMRTGRTHLDRVPMCERVQRS